jgi:hypothetical protein
MSVSYGGDSITFADGSTVASGWSGFKNRIINGAMAIDQRNAGASVTASDASYSVDRFSLRGNATGKYTAQRNAGSVTPPPGFTNYLGITSTSAYTPSSGDYIGVQHKIEGYNVADFDLGKTTAKTWTLSFWVRSSLTGTFGATYRNSAQNRSYAFTYTINQVNTWEKKTITTVGDTTGTWLTNNDVGLDLWFNLGSGSANSTGTTNTWQGTAYLTVNGTNNLVSTNGATWYITGVQLELGSTDSSFEWRPFGTELQLCQRYYEEIWCMWATVWSAGMNNFPNGTYKVSKRASPTMVVYADSTPLAKTGATGSVYNQTNTANISGANVNNEGTSNFNIDYNTGSVNARNMRATVTANAEL